MFVRHWSITGVQCVFLFLILGSLGVLYTACGAKSCKTALDCPAGEVCLLNSDGKTRFCKTKPDGGFGAEPSGEPTTGDSKADGDSSEKTGSESGNNGGNDGGSESVAEGGSVEDKPELPPGPQTGELVINEVLADPPVGAAGDSNKDGTRESSGDEFVEIVNTTKSGLNISGVVIDVGGKTYAFPAGTVLPAETAAVVFGGGMASDTEVNQGKPHSKFGGALVFTKLPASLLNGGATITLKSADGVVLSTFTYGTGDCKGDDQSLTLSPDLTGSCKAHKTTNAQASPFSPGTRTDGGKFSDPPAEVPPTEASGEAAIDAGEAVTEQPPAELPPEPPAGQTPASGDLVINELHSDPDSAKGDANKDGAVSTSSDEFIEIVNGSTKTLNMTGVEVYINTTSKVKVFTFGALSLGPNDVVVLFAGGSPPGDVGNGKPNTIFGCVGKKVFVYKYQKSKALANGGGTVSLQNPGDATAIAQFVYGTGSCKGDQNQSVTLSPDLTGTCKLHSDADTNKSLFSPGRKADGTCF